MGFIWMTILCCSLFYAEKTRSSAVSLRPDKPGKCPFNKIGIRCNREPPSECMMDLDCPGEQKCCRQGCSLICQNPVPDCGAVCAISCPFGNVLDKDGCPICKCKTGCRNEMKPLPYIDCGRVKPKCPGTHGCVFPKNLKTGVCCPKGYY